MNMNKLLAAGALPLPEDILKHKWSGHIDAALAAIEARLAQELPQMLRDRLLLERELLTRLPEQYPYTGDEALRAIRAVVPDFTQAEFDKIDRDGGMDFLYVRGERRYFESVADTVLQWDRALLPRAGEDASGAKPVLDDAIAQMQRAGSLAYRIALKVEYRVADSAFVPGELYSVHLPVPKPCAQQSNIHIQAQPDARIAPESAPQRTVFYARKLAQNEPFCVEYRYDSRVNYIDTNNPEGAQTPLYAGVPAPTPADLAELPPHMAFTPFLRQLAADVRGARTCPIEIARAAYDYVTQHVTYSYLRDYVLIDNMAEYMALGLRGDCGAQTLLFMALCRLNGIPTRWQSGTTAREDSVGAHDWCQFYVEPYGWLLCDVSFGGGAWRAGQLARWNFYFGNLDPFRMVANDAYMADFDPPFEPLRSDPFDNQSGECALQSRALLGPQKTLTRTLTLELLP